MSDEEDVPEQTKDTLQRSLGCLGLSIEEPRRVAREREF